MARVGSINHQVGNIIKSHNGIGQSKLESRNSSGLVSAESGHKVSDKFHSYKSLDNARNDLKNLGNYAKEEFGIKDMSQINREVVENWIRDKDITYNTASNYLSEINKVHEHLNITREEVKELRAELKTDLRTNELHSRAYSNLDRIQLPERSQPAFELQRDYGLRMSAATHINIEKQINGNTLKYQEKGGKWSEKELNPTLISKIKENAVEGKYELSKNTYRDQLQKEIEKSGQKYNGTHGIRHTYAQNQLEAGKSKQEVSESMGHSREGVTNTYLR
jgi:site-specific recombinase XerD